MGYDWRIKMVDWDCVNGIASDDMDSDWECPSSASQLVGLSSDGSSTYNNSQLKNKRRLHSFDYEHHRKYMNEKKSYSFYGLSVYSKDAYGVYMNKESSQLEWFPKSRCVINEKEHYIEVPNWIRYKKEHTSNWKYYRKEN